MFSQAFQCGDCDKTYKSESAYNRHLKLKHLPPPHITKEALKDITNKTVLELRNKTWLPEQFRSVFETVELHVEFLDNVNSLLIKYRDHVDLLPNFTNTMSKFVLCGKRHANLFVNEFCVQLLADWNRSQIDQQINFDKTSKEEVCVITYLSGYCFGKKYRQLRFSTILAETLELTDRLAVLSVPKIDISDDPKYDLVNAKNKTGGLWYVSNEVITMFHMIELKLRVILKQKPRQIDDNELSRDFFLEPYVIHVLTYLKDHSEVSKEICGDVLQDVIALYIRVRVYRFLEHFNEKLSADKISFRTSLLTGYTAKK